MCSFDGDFLLVREGADEVAGVADEEGAGFGIDEELGHVFGSDEIL